MNTTTSRYLFALIVAVLPAASFARTLTVTDFRVIEDGLYFPLAGPISGSPRVWNFGAVSITSPSASILGGVFQFDVDMTGPDPSGTSSLGYTGENAPAVFNLSRPVTALGVTFTFISTRNDAILRVYDGPNATGKHVGSVLSPVKPPPWSAENPTVDFVGVWTDKAIIRSFAIDGAVRGQGASITGYGVSFTPVPEPAAGTLASILVFSVASSIRRRRSHAVASTAC
jgi:hypothetical protein